jgi:hypothetical protein
MWTQLSLRLHSLLFRFWHLARLSFPRTAVRCEAWWFLGFLTYRGANSMLAWRSRVEPSRRVVPSAR